MFPDIPLEQERHSGGLPNILTAAHSWGREGDTKTERENILLSNAAFDFFFFPHAGLHFLSLEFQRRSYCRMIFYFYPVISKTILGFA